MPSLSSMLLLIQSISLNLFGTIMLFAPEKAGSPFSELPIDIIHVMGTTSVSLGIAFVVTAFQSRQARHNFLLAGVPVRLFAGWLFYGDGSTGTAIWDAGNGIVNLIVVALERS
ncbi:hypothetical protein BDV96DRAFT_587870, partial [Lophiotrema nucula]